VYYGSPDSYSGPKAAISGKSLSDTLPFFISQRFITKHCPQVTCAGLVQLIMPAIRCSMYAIVCGVLSLLLGCGRSSIHKDSSSVVVEGPGDTQHLFLISDLKTEESRTIHDTYTLKNTTNLPLQLKFLGTTCGCATMFRDGASRLEKGTSIVVGANESANVSLKYSLHPLQGKYSYMGMFQFSDDQDLKGKTSSKLVISSSATVRADHIVAPSRFMIPLNMNSTNFLTKEVYLEQFARSVDFLADSVVLSSGPEYVGLKKTELLDTKLKEDQFPGRRWILFFDINVAEVIDSKDGVEPLVIDLTSQNGQESTISIPCFTERCPGLLYARKIDMGALELGESAKQRIQIIAEGGSSAFELREAVTSSESLSVSIVPGLEGKKHWITIELCPLEYKDENSHLEITTNHKHEPLIRIDVKCFLNPNSRPKL
jgi:hypothetical protein